MVNREKSCVRFRTLLFLSTAVKFLSKTTEFCKYRVFNLSKVFWIEFGFGEQIHLVEPVPLFIVAIASQKIYSCLFIFFLNRSCRSNTDSGAMIWALRFISFFQSCNVLVLFEQMIFFIFLIKRMTQMAFCVDDKYACFCYFCDFIMAVVILSTAYKYLKLISIGHSFYTSYILIIINSSFDKHFTTRFENWAIKSCKNKITSTIPKQYGRRKNSRFFLRLRHIFM